MERMPDLPFDVILQILSRLPVKSLCRCKCVCKSWHAAIHERKFIEIHRRHSEIIEICHEKDSDGRYKELMRDANDGLLLVESTLRKEYHMRNPATKEIITIPRPHKRLKHIRFSYIQSIGCYKLIHAYCKEGTENGGCKVLIVGTDLQWRSMDIPSLRSLGYKKETAYSLVIKEVFYLIRFFTMDSHLSEIVYIEMGTDHFGHIKLSQELFRDWTNVGLVQWEGKLAVGNQVNHELHLCVLEYYKMQKWAERKIVISLSFLRDIPLLENLQPWYVVTGGWLHYAHGEYYVKFHIESKKLVTICAPSGKVLVAGYIRSSIVSLPGNLKQKLE